MVDNEKRISKKDLALIANLQVKESKNLPKEKYTDPEKNLEERQKKASH